MRIKKLLCILLAAAFVAGAAGCSAQNAPAPAADTTEYRFKGYYDWFLGKEEYQDFMQYVSSEENTVKINPQYAQQAYRDGDYLVILATEEQKNRLIEQNFSLLEQAGEEFAQKGENYRIAYPEDCASITIYLDKENFQNVFSANAFDVGGNALGIISLAVANRVLLTGDCDACVQVNIINLESGFCVSQGLFPYQALHMTDQDWQTSLSQDVKQSSDLEGYTSLRATVSQMDEQKIVFSPVGERTVYAEDDLLAVCLDSVYADEWSLPYHLAPGDEVVLTVNGLYAIHEDGDDIPDIAPLALIPAKYLPE